MRVCKKSREKENKGIRGQDRGMECQYKKLKETSKSRENEKERREKSDC